MNRIGKWLQTRKQYRTLENKAESIYLTRHRVHFPRFLTVLFRQLKKDNIPERAASMAFNFTLSIFPFIIFLFTLIPYIPIPNLDSNIMKFLKEFLPYSIYDAASSTITDIISNQHGDLLSFGFLFALFTATNGVGAMITAFNKCYRTTEKRSFIKKWLTSVYLVFFISVILFLSIGLSITSKLYLNYLENAFVVHNDTFDFYFILVLKYVILFILFFTSISAIYIIAPSVTVRWSFFSLGSMIASCIGLLFTRGFSYYIEQFNSYNKIYGSIGAFIGVMIWLYAISMVLLFGFEINASLDQIKLEMMRQSEDKK